MKTMLRHRISGVGDMIQKEPNVTFKMERNDTFEE
jgi:hypothetical protein